MDRKNLKRNSERKKRIESVQKLKSSTWLIVCEGTETEVNYFKSAIAEYNNKFPKGYKLDVDINGKGRGTTKLVNEVDSLIDYIDSCNKKTKLYGKVFVVFDKDDFGDNSFDSAINICRKNGYIPLWSNESFELWLLYYFQNIVSDISRKDLIIKLEENFKNKGLEMKYNKNDKDIFNKLCQYGNHEKAIKLAKKRLKECETANKLPSKSYSCTSVYYLFDIVEERLKELN